MSTSVRRFWCRPHGKAVLLACLAVFAVFTVQHGSALASTRLALAPTGIGGNGDAMGSSVALHSDTLLVSVPDAQLGVPLVYAGAVEVFRQTNGAWQLEDTLQPSDLQSPSRFGAAIALGDDLAVISGRTDDPTANKIVTFARAGAEWSQVDAFQLAPAGLALSGSTLVAVPGTKALVYVRAGSGWVQQAELGEDGEATTLAAIDGDTLATISVVWHDPFTFELWLSVYFRAGGQWTRQAHIDLDTFYGTSYDVAISGDTVLVGANSESSGLNVQAFVRTNGIWSLQGRLDPQQPCGGGVRLALDGDRALIGCPDDTVLGFTSGGTAYVFERDGSNWTRAAHLYDPEVGDFYYAFGTALALEGDLAAIGSPGGRTDGGATGKAQLFAPVNGAWQMTATVDDGNARRYEKFGSGVALDATTLVVGAPETSRANVFSDGTAYVFARSGDGWTPEAELVPSSEQTQGFGVVALDADTIAVGASWDGPAQPVGAVYVYARADGTWPLEARLVSGSTDPTYFGSAVALEGDTLVASAPMLQGGTGAAYVFERSGTAWSLPTPLLSNDGADGDRFGTSLSLDGDTLAIGAPYADIGIEADAGAVYLFERAGSTWAQAGKLTAPAVIGQAYFGQAVSLKGDTLLIGSGVRIGAAYVFVRSQGTWTWSATLAPASGPMPDSFGSAVALSGDEQIALVGAAYVVLDGPPAAGKAYAFVREGDAWQPGPIFQGNFPNPPYQNDNFGKALAFSDSDFVIGAPDEALTGAVYLGSLADPIFVDGFDSAP